MSKIERSENKTTIMYAKPNLAILSHSIISVLFYLLTFNM